MADRGWERQEIHLFTDSIFRGTPGLAAVTGQEINDGTVHVRFTSPIPVANAAIHWTTDCEKDWSARRWHSARVKLTEAGEASAALPPERPVVFFLTLMDRRGAVVSTEHIELKGEDAATLAGSQP